MRYINPGYAEFLDVDTATTANNATYNPTNGVAFLQTTDNDGVDIASPSATPSDFYMKFDIYIPPWADFSSTGIVAHVGYYDVHSGYSGFTGIEFYKNSSNFGISTKTWGSGRGGSAYYTSAGNGTSSGTLGTMKYGSVNTLYFHCETGSGAGKIQVYLNGVKVIDATGLYIFLDNLRKLVFYTNTDKADCYISNIIVGVDDDIDPKEVIQAVPLTNPVTDMVDIGDGSYLAESAGQQILQTVNVASLISAYGGVSQVTGIAIGGNPAYRTGEVLTSLIGISKASGDSQVEHGTKTLKTSTTAGTVDCYSVNTTIANMTGLQLGWKAGV